MANIGDVFTECPEGFTRFVYNQTKKDLFYPTNMGELRSWGVFGKSLDSSMTFYLKNATDIRFINLIESTCSVGNIYVNDELFGPYYSSFTGTEYSSMTGYNRMVAEIYPAPKYIKVVITNDNISSKQINFIAIDVNDTAELISEEEYLKETNLNFILKIGDVYKSYDKETNMLNVIDDISLIDKTYLTNCDISFIPNALNLLESLENVKLIISSAANLNIRGIKDNSEMIVMKNNIYRQQVDDIAKVFSDIQISGDSSIKFAISIDNGLTWQTFNGEWKNLEITIPSSKYDELSEEDKLLWNLAKSEINNNGIPYDQLESINFQDYITEKVKFAVVLSINNVDDDCELKSLNWNIKDKDYFQSCTKDEVNEILLEDSIKLHSNISTKQLIVNILLG